MALATGWRFSPQVLVFGLTFVSIFYAAQGAVVAGCVGKIGPIAWGHAGTRSSNRL